MKNKIKLIWLLFSLLQIPNLIFAQEKGEAVVDSLTVFDFIYQMKDKPTITIRTNTKTLIKNKHKEEYQVATFNLENQEKKGLLNLKGRLRTRGNIRKKVCKIPPIKFDFDKSDLDSLGFLNLDKLKFVLPCNRSKFSQEKLLKEFFLYQLYDQIDTNGMRVKLIDLVIINGEEFAYNMTGFLIEDEEEYMLRKNAIVIETAKVRPSRLERSSFLKMIFFQYMISNTDWSIINRHNIELVKLPSQKKVIAVPYDFDYSGFVGQGYAIPHPSLPLNDVHDRYCFESCKIRMEECDQMIDYFLSLETSLEAFCEKPYFNKNTIEEIKSYLKSFFNQLRKPKRIKNEFVETED